MPAQVSDWATPLSEPARPRKRFPASLGYFVPNYNFTDFRFVATESGDMALMAIYADTPSRNFARVSISEVSTLTSLVTIKEIRYARGYS